MRQLAIAMVLLLIIMPIRAAERSAHWVYFHDKGVLPGQMDRALERVREGLTPRSLERRGKSMTQLVDEYDLPVCEDHIARVAATGARVRRISRWLNAVSVEANESQRVSLQALPCVTRVEPFRLRRAELERPSRSLRRSVDDPNYGPSLNQNAVSRVPELHSRGLTGQGVLMCFLDTGFETRHESLDSLNVLGSYDFIFGDTIVTNQPEQDSSDQFLHGTAVLSTAAGFTDGMLVGPAFGAEFLLAKTEWVHSETPIEEDNYVAALEWADSLGVDITSSSVGYLDWYRWEDMNGQTATTTRAVNVAVSRGILVVTAAGNERETPWGHIIAPADADSILAVGAVDSLRRIAEFSSPGPTFDQRIKPDACAMGVLDVCANAWIWDEYWLWSGTSLATPLMSGIAALVMEAHPDWTAQQVRTAMLMTASHASLPDNDFGWGIVDGVAAVDFVIDGISRDRPAVVPAAVLLRSYPNPVNGMATISLSLPQTMIGRLALYDILSREVCAWPERAWSSGEQLETFDASDLPSGVYVARFTAPRTAALTRITLIK